MTKKELKNIMKRNSILPCEIDDAIAFVTELLEFQASEIERNEPYATRTIKDLENAAYAVWTLQDYISELEDDEDENES